MGQRDKKMDVNLDKYDCDLDQIKVPLKANNRLTDQRQDDLNVKDLTKDLIESNYKKFSFLFSSRSHQINQRKIERIYSKNEIRQLVCENLISEYQHEQIINAVTDFLYGIHVSA